MSNNKLTTLERIGLEVVWSLCYFIGHMPHYVLFYMIAPAIRFIIYRVLRYRVKMVDKNLKKSFPEISDKERIIIRDRFYTYLSEVIMSTIALTNKRSNTMIITNLDPEKSSSLDSFRELTKGQSWIALSAHLGLWEYQMFWARFSNQRLVGVYHPLENRLFDILFKRLRNHYRVLPMPAKESLRFAIRNGKLFREDSYVLGLLADQNPPLLPNSHWYTFLNQDTIFFDGGEKIALKVGLPVYFIYQRRISPGRYEMCYKPIWDGVESVEPNEITTRYVNLLDQIIRETPYMWLWSHNRWKRSRESMKEAAWVNSKKGA